MIMTKNMKTQNHLVRSFKKMPVFFSKECHPEVTEELLAVLFEESGIEPICFEKSEKSEDGTLDHEDIVAPLMIQADVEIICPLIHFFDSDVFVLNYRKYYDL